MNELLFFTGQHCGTCKLVKSRIDARLSQNPKNKMTIREVSVDTDEGRKLAASYFVNSLPTVIHIKDGKPAKTYLGSTIVDNLITVGLI